MANKDLEKRVAYQKAWYAKNKAKAKEYRAKYYQDHREALKSYAKERRIAKPEEAKAATELYRSKNKAKVDESARNRTAKWRSNPDNAEKQRTYLKKYHTQKRGTAKYKEQRRFAQMRRRALKKKAAGTCTVEQLRARVELYGGLCWLKFPGCTIQGTTIDHVIPLSKGGTNWPSNLRPACKHCNSSKGSKKLKSSLTDLGSNC